MGSPPAATRTLLQAWEMERAQNEKYEMIRKIHLYQQAFRASHSGCKQTDEPEMHLKILVLQQKLENRFKNAVIK